MSDAKKFREELGNNDNEIMMKMIYFSYLKKKNNKTDKEIDKIFLQDYSCQITKIINEKGISEESLLKEWKLEYDGKVKYKIEEMQITDMIIDKIRECINYGLWDENLILGIIKNKFHMYTHLAEFSDKKILELINKCFSIFYNREGNDEKDR